MTTNDDDRLDGIEYWRAVAAREDDVVFDERIDAALGAEWTPLTELDEHTEARGGVVRLAGANYRADAVDGACEAAVAGTPMHVHAVATPITQDRHAVSIYAEPAGRGDVEALLLGYLPREIARLVHDDLANDDLVVLPVVYLPDNGRSGRPGMRLVVARRAEEPSWAFTSASLAAVGRIRRRPAKTPSMIRQRGTTAFEHWLGERPEVLIRRVVEHLASRVVRIDHHDIEPPRPGEPPWQMPPSILFPSLEHLVDAYSDQELVAAAAAWGTYPDRMAQELGSELRSRQDDEFDETDFELVAAETAERWRRHVAHRLLALDA